MKTRLATLLGVALLASGCGNVALQAEVPSFDTGIDPAGWVSVPAGEFLAGQFAEPAETPAYDIMVTTVTVSQYAEFVNEALASGDITVVDDELVGFYPGDEFRGYNHEEPIEAGEWLLAPLDDPSQRVRLVDGRYRHSRVTRTIR